MDKTKNEILRNTLVRNPSRPHPELVTGELHLAPVGGRIHGAVFACDLETLPFGAREKLELELCNAAGDQGLSFVSTLERAYFRGGKWWLHFSLNPWEIEEIRKLA